MLSWLRAVWASLTTRGTAFVAAGACLLIAGLLLGQRDLTRAGLLLVILVLVSAWLLRRHGTGLEIVRTLRPPHAAIDDVVIVDATIRQAGRQSSGVVFADEHLAYHLGERPRFVIPALRPGEQCRVQYSLRPSLRGVHLLGPMGIRVKDVFGLTVRVAQVGGQDELLVVPTIVDLAGSPPGSTGLGTEGAGSSVVSLHGEDDQGIREYRRGDDLRRIHWPASARTGDLMVRQEDRPLRRQALVLLDSRVEGHVGTGRASTMEWAVTMVASVSAHLHELGYAVTTLVPDPASPTGVIVAEDLTTTLVALARVTPTGATSLADLLHAARGLTRAGGLVVIVSGALRESQAVSVAALRQPGSAGLALVADIGNSRLVSPALAQEHAGGVEVLRQAGFRTESVQAVTPHAAAWARLAAARVGQRG